MALPTPTIIGQGRVESELIFNWDGPGDGSTHSFEGQQDSLTVRLWEDSGRVKNSYECEFFKITAVAADGWKFDHWEYRNERWREYTYDGGPGSSEQTETDTSTSTLTFRSNPAVNADPEHSYDGPIISGLPIGSVRQETIWEWGEDEPLAAGQMYRAKREILHYRCVGFTAVFVPINPVGQPLLVHDPVTRKLVSANNRLLNGM